MEFLALRSALIATANELNDSGINQGTSGNLSGEHNFSCKPSSELKWISSSRNSRPMLSSTVCPIPFLYDLTVESTNTKHMAGVVQR